MNNFQNLPPILLANQYFSPKILLKESFRIIQGIGIKQQEIIFNYLGITKKTCIGELNNEQYQFVKNYVENQANNWKQIQEKNVTRLKEAKNRRYFYRKWGYPVNGQRTKTNAKTAKRFHI